MHERSLTVDRPHGSACLKRAGVALLLVLAVSWWSPARVQAARPAERNVLVVLPHTQDYPAHAALVTGLKDGLQAQGQHPVRISYEYLDLARFADEEAYLSDVAAFFQRKYAKLKPDVVVTGATLAKFMLAHGKRMFPGVPIVFAWNENLEPLEAMPEGFSIVSGNVDYARNVELLFQTRPETRKVFVVIGTSEEERYLLPHISRVLEPHAGRAEFVYTNTMTHEQMWEAVRHAGQGAAVLFVLWMKDAEGRSYMPSQLMSSLCREAGAPVYAFVEHMLGKGVVGGFLYSFELLGRRIAEKTLAILAGNDTSGQVSRPLSSTYAFDWRELKRWNIDIGKLPPGSRVEFQKQTVWEQYHAFILAGCALVLLEALLIVGLVFNRSGRMRVEAQLLHLNASLERMVSRRTRDLQEANERLEQAMVQLEEMNRQLDRASRTDSLTGLYNRRHMEERIHEEYLRFGREGGVFSIVVADVDYFKEVNDRYGHDAGDDLLEQLSADIVRSVREYDTVARWGGEEFLLLLPGRGLEAAGAVAERIRSVVEARRYSCGTASLSVTLTLGVGCPRPGDALADVFKRADDALYEGKRAGRNRVVAA